MGSLYLFPPLDFANAGPTSNPYILPAGDSVHITTSTDIYEDLPGSDPCENLDPIAAWRNLGTLGAGQLVAQNTAGFRPHYLTGIVNGKPIAEFDGIDDRLAIALSFSPTNQPSSLFAVVRLDATWLTAGTILSFGNSGTGSGPYRVTVTAGRNVTLSGPGGVLGTSTYVIPLETWTLITILHDRAAGTIDFRFNGVFSNQAVGVPLITFDNVAVSVVGGNAVVPTQPFNGDITEIIHYHSFMSGSNLANAEGYLMFEYGL